MVRLRKGTGTLGLTLFKLSTCWSVCSCVAFRSSAASRSPFQARLSRCGMPRTARASAGNVVYHVINRGNARNDVFHKPEDFVAFPKLMRQASVRLPMRLLAYCLMNNHFHLVLWPHEDGDLSRWMQCLMTAHGHSTLCCIGSSRL